jgi:hypothetical protein
MNHTHPFKEFYKLLMKKKFMSRKRESKRGEVEINPLARNGKLSRTLLRRRIA